jgi:hypothetical protein
MNTYRYYVRSPDGRAIFGFDRLEAATAVALEYGLGAALVDTMAQAYHPMLQEVKAAESGNALVYAPLGGWDTGRFGVDRDLIEGIKKGHAAIVHAFLAKGASANARDGKGGPALHWAVARGNADVVRLLLASGADVDAGDGRGQTALDVARTKDQAAIVELLLAAGAKAAS